MRPCGVIALMTDFGTSDGYVGAMKGVILSLASRATLVDIAHDVPPFDARIASLLLASATPRFPVGTVFVAVVDPGVGTLRRPIAARTDRAWFVGPDNGLFTDALDGARAVLVVDSSSSVAPAVSPTFHGRDVFAPIAARLANGEPLERFGAPVADWVRLSDDAPVVEDGVVCGRVVFADRFGNLVTNVRRDSVDAPIRTVRLNGRDCGAVRETYASVPRGAWLALWNSFGRLEIARNEMSAARSSRWRPGVNAVVEAFLDR